MNRTSFFLLSVGVILLLSFLSSFSLTGADQPLGVTITPTAFCYLPFVTKNWPPPPVPRQIVDLDGTWLYAYSEDATLPPEASWAEVEVPSFVAWDMNRPYIWFRRTFSLPPSFPRDRVYLDFQGIKYAAKVYLNGTLLGEHNDGFTPFELAVPAEVLTSSNELLIQVSDWRSALAPEAAQREVSDPEEVEDSLIYPIGSQHYWLGIWQDAALIAYPRVRIKDVFVRTSVRDYKIELEITLENLTDRTLSVSLGNEVLEGSEVVLPFASVDVSLAPREIRIIKLEQPWADPHLWSPDDPHLYHLRSHLSSGDELIVQFGFREFWIEGNEFYLNGKRTHLRATAAHPFAFSKENALYYLRKAKQGNNVIMRLHAQPWPSWWYEAADEVGMLIVWESGYWCYGRGYRVEDDRFWFHFEEHLHDQMLLQRNHPSIIIWSLENELLHTSGGRQGADPRLRATEASLAELVPFVKSLDPTRPIMFEGDADPGMQADIVNLHYPHEYPLWNLWPDEAWWLEFTNQTDSYPGEIPGWPLEKPFYIGEFLWVPHNWIEGASIFFGDRIYRDVLDYHQRGKATAWAYQIEAYRALGVQGICPWNIWGDAPEQPNPLYYTLVQEKFAPNGLYLREKNRRFFSGDMITRTAYLFNDLLQYSHLTVTWELRSETGIMDSGAQEFYLNPAEIVQFDIELQAPLVEQESTAEISYRVQRAGTTVFSYEEPIRLYPHRSIQAENTIYLYDPAGTSATVLESEGIDYRPLTDLSAIPPEAELVIVGRDGLEDGDDWRRIQDFAARGGRALILRHERNPEGGLLRLATGGATIAFPRRPSHPILANISKEELRFWRPDNLVINKPLIKPDSGLYKVLIDAGSAKGLKYAGLMELEARSGTILLSQLGLLAKLDSEPVTRKLFQNILNYLAGYQPRSERQFQLVQATPEERQIFQAIGFDIEEPEPTPIAGDQLIFASGEVDRVRLANLLERVEQDSILWLHKPSADVLERLSDFQLDITTQVPPPSLISVTEEPQAEGLTSYSLAWVEEWPKEYWKLPRLLYDLANIIFEAEADFSNAVEILPSKFTVEAELSDVAPDRISLYTNGYLEADIEIAEAGRYNLGLLAQGTPAANRYPAVRVKLDGETLGTVTIGGEQQIYYLTAELPAGRHCLRLEFFNDYYAPPEDRNLYFFKLLIAQVSGEYNLIPLTRPPALVEVPYGSGYILLDGLNWEEPGAPTRKQEFLVSLLVNSGIKLEPPSVYVVLGAEEVEIVAGELVYKRDSGIWFATNGTIAAEVNFAEDGKYLFRVLASGTQLGGVYPQFELAIDGQVVASKSLESETESYYFIESEVPAGIHQLSLSFINDAYAPPEDRNLFVERIVITKE